MLKLILVRHGETDSNIRGTYCGWTDALLNEKGRKQAQIAAEKLKDEKFAAVYSSPLNRAYATAEIICGNSGLQPICTESLKEQNFGQWEDFTYDEIKANYPNECAEWQDDWSNYCMKDGESAYHVFQRVSAFIDGISRKHGNCTVVLVTHLGCIRFIISYLLGMSMDGFWRFRVNNGSISKLTISEGNFAYLHALNT